MLVQGGRPKKKMAGTTRLELATSAVTALRGECPTRRKSYKTTRMVGWVAGWKIVSPASGTPHRKSISVSSCTPQVDLLYTEPYGSV